MNKQQAMEEINKGNIIKETLSNGETVFYFELKKGIGGILYSGEEVKVSKIGKYWGAASFWCSMYLDEKGEFERADEKEFGGIDNVYYEADAEKLQTNDEIKEGKLKLVEKLNFEKYGFSNKKVISLQDSDHLGEMNFKFQDLTVKCLCNQDKADFTVKIKLTKYSVAGEFFPKLKKIQDKIKEITKELSEWKRVQEKELKKYSKKLTELIELKEKGDKYLNLLEEGGEVKIYRFGNKYFTDTFIKGSDSYNSQSMIYTEIELDDTRILKLRKHTNIDVRIYDLIPAGEGEDYSLNI